MIDDKYQYNLAVEFFVSALTDKGDRAHEIAHIVIEQGPQFSHNFDASLYYLIHTLKHFINENWSESKVIIKELCTYLKHRELTANCIHLRKKLEEKAREYYLIDSDDKLADGVHCCPICEYQFIEGESRLEESGTHIQVCIDCVETRKHSDCISSLEDFFGPGSNEEDKFV